MREGSVKWAKTLLCVTVCMTESIRYKGNIWHCAAKGKYDTHICWERDCTLVKYV